LSPRKLLTPYRALPAATAHIWSRSSIPWGLIISAQ
jgi:hypothetical protein